MYPRVPAEPPPPDTLPPPPPPPRSVNSPALTTRSVFAVHSVLLRMEGSFGNSSSLPGGSCVFLVVPCLPELLRIIFCFRPPSVWSCCSFETQLAFCITVLCRIWHSHRVLVDCICLGFWYVRPRCGLECTFYPPWRSAALYPLPSTSWPSPCRQLVLSLLSYSFCIFLHK